MKNPEACIDPRERLLNDLIYGWGNESWSALHEYLAACVKHALSSHGPILECGSGLTTILVGAIATKLGHKHWALEHSAEWSARVQRCLDRYAVGSVVLCTTPLHDHGNFAWYDAPLQVMPDNFSLVICDGPPGHTKGGRVGLVPIMRDRLKSGCVILLDDASREEECAIARLWEAELGASSEVLGSIKPYIRITVMNMRQEQPVEHGITPSHDMLPRCDSFAQRLRKGNGCSQLRA